MWLSAVKRVSFKGATIHPDTLNLFLDQMLNSGMCMDFDLSGMKVTHDIPPYAIYIDDKLVKIEKPLPQAPPIVQSPGCCAGCCCCCSTPVPKAPMP